MGQVLLLLCLLLIGSGLGAVWEFGEDRKNSVVISTNNGDISILQKITRVQFNVPSCHKVVYVRVQVDNDLTTPAVNFEKETNTIIIHYKLLQSSLSKYIVVAKAIKEKHCGVQTRKRRSKMKQLYGPRPRRLKWPKLPKWPKWPPWKQKPIKRPGSDNYDYDYE